MFIAFIRTLYGVQGGRLAAVPILPNCARRRSMSAFSSASVA